MGYRDNWNIDEAGKKKSGAHGTKDNSECASERLGNKLKPEAVTEVDPNANKGAAVECARKQNTMDKGTDSESLAVLPNTGTLKPPRSSHHK